MGLLVRRHCVKLAMVSYSPSRKKNKKSQSVVMSLTKHTSDLGLRKGADPQGRCGTPRPCNALRPTQPRPHSPVRSFSLAHSSHPCLLIVPSCRPLHPLHPPVCLHTTHQQQPTSATPSSDHTTSTLTHSFTHPACHEPGSVIRPGKRALFLAWSPYSYPNLQCRACCNCAVCMQCMQCIPLTCACHAIHGPT